MIAFILFIYIPINIFQRHSLWYKAFSGYIEKKIDSPVCSSPKAEPIWPRPGDKNNQKKIANYLQLRRK